MKRRRRQPGRPATSVLADVGSGSLASETFGEAAVFKIGIESC
jgi:hypothetical protein